MLSNKKNKGYLLKFYIFTSMYILAALFILYLTFRANAHSQDLRNIHFRVSAEAEVVRIKPTVIIDAGHGGADGGAVGVNGEIEKDINLAIALKLRRLFNMSNFQVILTRDTDILLNTDGVRKKKASDLANRAKVANNNPSAIFISIHMNKFPQERYSGLQVFFSPNNLDSANLADLIRTNNREYLQLDNNREIKKGRDMFVLENIKNIGVLIECGFLSNREEAALLATEEHQIKLARIIFASIAEFEKTFND